MRLTVEVSSDPQSTGCLVEGTLVRAEIRDTTAVDASSVTLASGTGVVVTDENDRGSAVVELDVNVAELASSGDYTVWAHCDVDNSDEIASGDWITVQSWPVSASRLADSDRLSVEVRQIS